MTPSYLSDPVEPKVVAPKDWYAAPAVRPGTDPRPGGAPGPGVTSAAGA
jgi:hypothetical protein